MHPTRNYAQVYCLSFKLCHRQSTTMAFDRIEIHKRCRYSYCPELILCISLHC